MKTQQLTIAGLAALAVVFSLIIAMAPRSTVVYGDMIAEVGDYSMSVSGVPDASTSGPNSDIITIFDSRNSKMVTYQISPYQGHNVQFEVLSIFDLNQAFGAAPATPSKGR